MSERKRVTGRLILEVAPRILRDETHLLSALKTPLTHRQYRILSRVSEGTTSLTAISKAAYISVAAISESADALLKRGLIEREVDKNDRRASNLSLTKQGNDAIQEADRTLDALANRLVANLSMEELVALDFALSKVNDTVKQDLLKRFTG